MTITERIAGLPWPTPMKHLSSPISVRINERPFIIRSVRKVRDRIMAKMEMDDDNMMHPVEALPWNIQELILERLN